MSVQRIPNTLGVLAEAERVALIRSEADALRTVRSALDEDTPLTILGGGSNVVLGARLHGIVALVRSRGVEVAHEGAGHAVLRVAAGEPWHGLVMRTLAEGYRGLENLSLIPGSVGAAPIQNIGAYGVEVAEFVEAVEAVSLSTGDAVTLPPETCKFAYRDSLFRRDGGYLVTALRLRFDRKRALVTSYPDVAEAMARADGNDPQTLARAVIGIREAKLPAPEQVGNVGSFFKNPVVSADQAERLRGLVGADLVARETPGGIKLAAAQLIDRAGWRGVQRYGVKVWPTQPLVLVNDGTSRGRDFLKMAGDIARDIADLYEVSLEREPVSFGVF